MALCSLAHPSNSTLSLTCDQEQRGSVVEVVVVVGGDGVLIHPWVESVLVVGHVQPLYIQAAVPLGH